MPNKIEAMKVIMLDYDIYFSNTDSFISFAYPGMYAGLADTCSEALHMAHLRYRAGRKAFFDARSDATDRDWTAYTTDRETKFKAIYKAKGISDDSCWVFGEVEKVTNKGNT